MALKSGRQMSRISSRTLSTPFFATSGRRSSLGGSRPIASTEPPLARGARRLGIALFLFFVLVGVCFYGVYAIRGAETPYADKIETVLLVFSAIPAAASYIAGRALAWVFS